MIQSGMNKNNYNNKKKKLNQQITGKWKNLYLLAGASYC